MNKFMNVHAHMHDSKMGIHDMFMNIIMHFLMNKFMNVHVHMHDSKMGIHALCMNFLMNKFINIQE